MRKIFTTIFAAALIIQSATAWTGSIHAGIAAIAHDNMTEEAKSAVVDILGGHSIVYAASLPVKIADNIAIGTNGKAVKAKKAAKSENKVVAEALLLQEIDTAIATLKNSSATKEQAAVALKALVCAIGDLHCPGHYVYTDALQLCDIAFLHTKDPNPRSFVEFWESAAFYGTYSWKTNEFVHQLSRKTPEQVAVITAGNIKKWADGNAASYRPLYSMVENGHHFEKGIEYRLWLNDIYPIAIEQIAVAGYRLAAVLNSLF